MGEFKHSGPVARDFFFEWVARIIAILGPFASGKSFAAAMKLVALMNMQEPDRQGIRATRFLIVRNTYKNLIDGTWPTVKQVLQSVGYDVELDSKQRIFIRGKLADGTTIESEWLLRAMDDPANDLRNLLSLELTAAWVEECREVAFETTVAIAGRCGRWPSRSRGVQATWSGVILTSNPWYAESPYHEAFVIKPREGYKLFHQPSGVSPEAENTANLPDDYYQRMEQDLAGEPDKLAVHCYSQFGALRSGQVVYRAYNDSVHCRAFDLPRNATVRIGVDFGIRACAATLDYRSPAGTHYVFDEVVCFDADLPTFIDTVRARLTSQYPGTPVEWIVGDRAGTQRNLAGVTAFQIAAARGMPMIPAATNELSVRLAAVNKLLTTMASDGKPAFQLHPRCTFLREGFLTSYKFDQGRNGRLQDLPLKNDHSHVHDSLQYVAMHSIGAVSMAHGNGPAMNNEQFARALASQGNRGWSAWL